ncbi:protein NODULATION SIGNALING PATHWAY 2-like [Rhodamnia argentea]|uniref:Protein NODULATION SIGNALING PATHWAY 2-like n=1 Tax=Rhodamnia argentea TaxID=178133 RepID=A0A8B8NRU8_9MYRT|nr:protein NODULATION SIGNALING PATHWAY 2-like [Rhodamnia argentea]
MALANDVDDVTMMEFSGHSTTAADADEFDGGCCDWSDWSPVVDWDAVPGSGLDGFHDLMESMLEDGTGPHPHHLPPQWCDSPPSVHDATNDREGDGTDGHDFKGLRLVHLLLAAAEALSGKGENRELARVILVRLKELVSPASGGGGTNMERLAGHFTDALQGLLEGARAAGQGGGGKHSIGGRPHREEVCYNQTEVLVAFHLLQDMSPYVKFGHFTANQAILEAVGHERRVHVVDYDIMEGVQWASLMQALVSQKGGRPSPHLRITALSRAGSGRRWTPTVQDTGRRLAAYAKSVGQPFSFHQCRLDPDKTFPPAVLKLVPGEALVFNCMLHLPHSAYHTPGSVASFLSGARALSPRLVTLAEEEVGLGGGGVGFMGGFMDSLQHYSAVYDSLEAGFPMPDRARALVERVFLGPRIAGTLARMHRGRPGEEEDGSGKVGSWGEWLGAEGYRPGRVSFSNHCQAKLLVGLFNDGYRVEEVAGNRLVLGWKSRRLLSASIWTSSSDPDSLD